MSTENNTPDSTTPQGSDHLLSNRVYDTVKTLAVVLLPALGTLYFGLAKIWGLPSPEEVVGTITVVDTFLGVLLAASTKSYNNSESRYAGEFRTTSDGKMLTKIVMNSDPDTTRGVLEMKVVPEPEIHD